MSTRSGEIQSKAEQEGQSGPRKGLRNQKWETVEKVTFIWRVAGGRGAQEGVGELGAE